MDGSLQVSDGAVAERQRLRRRLEQLQMEADGCGGRDDDALPEELLFELDPVADHLLGAQFGASKVLVAQIGHGDGGRPEEQRAHRADTRNAGGGTADAEQSVGQRARVSLQLSELRVVQEAVGQRAARAAPRTDV